MAVYGVKAGPVPGVVFIPDFEANQIMKEGSQWDVDEIKVYYAGIRAFQYVDDF